MNLHTLKNNIAVLITSILIQVLLRDLLLKISENFLILAIDILPFLWLPFSVPRMAILLYGFLIGFIVDIIFFTPGFSMTIFVGVAFIRDFILNLLVKNNAIDKRPSFSILGFPLYMGYLLFMFWIYFLMFYGLQYWNIKVWFTMSVPLHINVIMNTAFVLVVDFFLFSSARNKYHSMR